jgi:aldose 1-epimerase
MVKKELLKEKEGKKIYGYCFQNKNGMELTVTNYGATIISIKTPDRTGKLEDVVLGLSGIDDYMAGHPFLGSTAGRYANRIAGGKFCLNGREYSLARNENNLSHLHGGNIGFDKAIWEGEVQSGKVVLSLSSPDMDEGYPAKLDVKVSFSLNDDNEVGIEYYAVSDGDTIVNLTNHSYFNLTGCKRDILDHKLKINADFFTPVNKALIPTGEILKLEDTPLDFSDFHTIGDRIGEAFEQLTICGGYDHNFVLRERGYKACAELYDQASGRFMTVFTDKPAVQLYTGNFLGDIKGRDGTLYSKNFGVCLETQFYPDSPNHAHFPNCVLKAGQIYSYKTAFRFETK